MREPTLLWASEAVIHCDATGRYWAPYPSYHSHSAAIRQQFGHLRLSLRCRPRDAEEGEAIWLSEDKVSVAPLIPYRGVFGLVGSLPRLLAQIGRELRTADALTVRLPGPIGSLHALLAVMHGKPFSVHMVGDPDDVLRSEGFKLHEKVLRLPLVWLTRFLCRRAVACAYVTDQQLQRRYPAASGVPSISISNVVLEHADLADGPLAVPQTPARLCFCGSLEQHYKGLDTLLDALADLRTRNIAFQLDVLGGGRFLGDYERGAKRRGLNDLVTFHGVVPRGRVLEFFRQCDLFVMPSRTEGLPRAMIEAMAQGLPCVGTRVGGIPELLDDAALVPVDDVRGLADRIAEFLGNPALYSTQAARNLRRSQDFLAEKIDERRLTFHSALRAAVRGAL